MYDADIRKLLMEHLKEMFAGTDAYIVNEFDICYGDSRIDVAVISQQGIYGYEIKSDHDSLERLPRQISFYSKVCDQMTLVHSDKFTEKINQMGILNYKWNELIPRQTDGKMELVGDRTPAPWKRNIDELCPYQIAALTWKDEALDILSKHGITNGYKNKSRHEIWTKIIETMTLPEIQHAVIGQILKRKNWSKAKCEIVRCS